MDVFGALVTLAFFNEWFCERFFSKWVKGYWMVALAAFFGIVWCLLFQLDGMALSGLLQPIGSPWTGQVITGIAVGAGSDFVHAFFKGRRTV